ncbi:MAG: hypothetical protein FWE59_01190 [Oscillospiraceae bacterium]|nr:hypothetical protein [Oscillospiraceae bacterium]
MKRKSMFVTIAGAVFIIVLGIFFSPFLYHILLNSSDTVSEQYDITETLTAQSAAFISNFMFPKNENRRPINIAEEIDEREVLGASKLFQMAGLNYESSLLDRMEETTDTRYRVLGIDKEINGSYYTLFLALDENNIPLTFRYKRLDAHTTQDIQNAVIALHSYMDGDPSAVSDYMGKIDAVYDGAIDSKLQLIIDEAFGNMHWSDKPSYKISLWECFTLGEWDIFSDKENVVLAFVMGRYNLQLYYDPVTKDFCGYNLATNQTLFGT